MTPILIVNSHKREVIEIKKIFESVDLASESVVTLDEGIQKLQEDPPLFVVVEKPERIETLQSLNETIKAKAPNTSFMVTMPHHDVKDAIEAMRFGAFDCVASPLERFDILAVAKRASNVKRRTLFVKKVERPRRRLRKAILIAGVSLFLMFQFMKIRSGGPRNTIDLGSAHLAGIQWDGRSFWVGDWFDSTVTEYRLTKGFRKKSRKLERERLNKMREGQPLAICRTEDNFVSIGTDLNVRTHHYSSELPTLLTSRAPGLSPSGLVWDGDFYWSSDIQSGKLYRHGNDLRVIEVLDSIIPKPVGLAADGGSLWVVGGTPLQAAKMEKVKKGYVWRGPFHVLNVLPEKVIPTGMAVGFDRLWFISGGDPRMVSISLDKVTKAKIHWKEPSGEKGTS